MLVLKQFPIPHLLPILLTALVLLVGCGCTPTPDTRLVRAEALMDEHPDSAWHILSSLDSTAMSSGADSCLYRLLVAEVHCKNHLGMMGDSLLDGTINYFKDRDDALHLSKAYYFDGRRHEYNGHLRDDLRRHRRYVLFALLRGTDRLPDPEELAEEAGRRLPASAGKPPL